jgi:hypothetical protein
VILTNFEISHASVWVSPICTALFHVAAGNGSAFATSSSRKGAKGGKLVARLRERYNASVTASWGDSALHTLCVVMSLKESEILRIEDVLYQFKWSNTAVSAEKDKRIKTDRYSTASVEVLDETFAAQRLGWLGGDVATSVPLPNVDDLDAAPNKLLFLFGDSIIGTSDTNRYS